MTIAHNPGQGWRRVSLTAVFVLLAVVPLMMQRRDASGPPPVSKLTTILADLAGSVPQGQGPLAGERSGQGARLSVDALPRSVQDAMTTRRLRIDSNNGVQVYVLLEEVTEENLQQLRAAGATIEITDAARRRVQARIPVARLSAVAALPFVTFVRLPSYGVHRVGSVTTEGDAILHSDAVRSQLGLDGTGVKVGVISDGLKGVFASGCTTCAGVANGPIAKGDLPSATGTRTSGTARTAGGVLTSSSGGIAGRSFPADGDLEGLIPGCAFAGAGAEGTALLEIVHDIAPGAQLAFANFDTDLAFNQAVNFLASTNDVVVDDIGFYGDAYDGTSSVSSNTAAALNNPANRIRAYVTSAGNAADEHYLGTYLPSPVDPTTIGITTPGHLHEFNQGPDTTDVLGRGPKPYNLIQLPVGGQVLIFLTWNDPFGASGNNYDLYLVRESTNAVVFSSTDVQKGGQDPFEFIPYTNTGVKDFFRIVVQNVNDQAAPEDLNIFSFQPECAASGPLLLAAGHHERHNYNTATRSVSAQSDAGGSPVSVISVGAICSASAAAQSVFSGSSTPDESCLDARNSTIEFFSSRGPTIDGRVKPDIAGIDGIAVTAAGSFANPFFGTSAAAPHVAGIAALALQSAPCLIAGATGAADAVTARAALRSLIVQNADGLGDANTFGSGRANALASVQAALPVFSDSTGITVPGTSPAGASLALSQLGFSDPNQCRLTGLKWTGGCGTSPGTTLNCPLGTTTVSVSATNNGLAFSPPVTVQITVSSFAVAAAPASATVNAGQSAVYQLTVSAQGGAFPASVALGCANLPPQTSCSFDPPTVTPGATSAQSTLTISTTAPRTLTAAPGASFLAGLGRVFTPAIPVEAVGRVFTPAMARLFTPVNGAATICLLAFVLTIAIGVRAASRRRLATMSALSMAVAFLLAQLACGSSSTPPATPPPSPSVALSPASLTFGTQFVQTTSAPQTITLTNSGKAALAITNLTASGDFAQTNTCGTSVAAGGSCSINVSFTPTLAGQRSGTVTIVDNAANSPQTVSLTGTGQAANGTPAGSYPVSVTGVSGALAQSGSLTLVVR
jgi:hypothetical protein